MPNVQPTYTQGKVGRQQNLETEVVRLQEKLRDDEDVMQIYKKHTRDLTKELAKEKNLVEKTESERQELLLR